MPTESGRAHDIYRCAACRIAVGATTGGGRRLRFLRVATLDEPHALAPDVHIFTRSKVPWVGLPPDVPAVPVYYDMQALWPADSLARRRAILGDG